MSDLSRSLQRDETRGLAGVALATRVLGSVPRLLDVEVGAFGRVTLAWDGAGAPGAVRANVISFVLSRGTESARLDLDAVLANRIVAAALGADAALAPTLGRLGPAARGVVGGFVAGVLHAADAPLVVSLASTGATPVDAIAAAVRVTVADTTGWALLEAPRAWLDDARSLPQARDELAALTVVAAVELASTTLTAGELAELSRGDAVVFEGEDGLQQADAWSARLVIGDFEAEATIAADGALTLTRDFRARGDSSAAQGDVTGQPARGHGRDTTVLTALPVEIVAELARVSLRGDELSELGQGAVVALGARGDGVTLRVAGASWGAGTLVDVDGALAVRVTRTPRG